MQSYYSRLSGQTSELPQPSIGWTTEHDGFPSLRFHQPTGPPIPVARIGTEMTLKLLSGHDFYYTLPGLLVQ